MYTNPQASTGNSCGTASRQICWKVRITQYLEVILTSVRHAPGYTSALTARRDTANIQHLPTCQSALPFNLGFTRSLYPVDSCLCLILGLNATPSQPLPQEVRFLPQPGSETEAPKGLTLSVASVPVLSKHPLGMCLLSHLSVTKCVTAVLCLYN